MNECPACGTPVFPPDTVQPEQLTVVVPCPECGTEVTVAVIEDWDEDSPLFEPIHRSKLGERENGEFYR